MARAKDGTRWIDGKLFVLRSVHPDKDYAKKIARTVREGDSVGAHGHTGPHYVRVVRHDYGGISTPELIQRWAVYCFPKDETPS